MGEVAIQSVKLPSAQETEAATIISVIERAARDPSVDIDKMERLMLMHQGVTDRQARTAYSSALAEMQEHLPVIEERGKIDIGRGKPQSYALWEDINEAIKPVLSRFGFALSFRTGRDSDRISVTGILSHRDGHREETTMHLPLDQSGSKNSVQAVGSSTSYGKRYTASALLNLTSRVPEDRDDDGQAGGSGSVISDDQQMELRDLADSVGADLKKFLAYLKVPALSALPAARFEQAVQALKAKAARK